MPEGRSTTEAVPTREGPAVPLLIRQELLFPTRLLQRHHIHPDLQAVFCAPEQNPANGADVAIIPAPSQGDVPVGGHAVVGGIEVHPSKARTPGRTPGMRGVRTYQSGAARRR